jgi:cardiolipin synthase
MSRARGLHLTENLVNLRVMAASSAIIWNWLRTGDEMFPAMLAAIDSARQSVCLETYIFTAGELGRRFRDALTGAARRGVRVRVLVDAGGSLSLPDDFWSPLRSAGGEAKFFNPLALKRFGIRNHRKLLACDGRVAFVGGSNIAPEYEGDGVMRGWCDLGLRVEGPLVAELASSFDEMFGRADFRHKPFVRLRRAELKRSVAHPQQTLLLSGPGRGRNPIQRALRADLRHARNAQIMVAYFLPTLAFRRDVARVGRRGGTAQLLLPGRSDVAMSQLAGQSLYRRLLRAGVEVFEYQPQILHAKLFVVDDVVYVGSANLDPRSLSINYELMLRFENTQMAREAREIFGDTLRNCQPVELATWQKSRSLWTRLRQRWAHFVLARIDPFVARRQWRALPD